MKIFMLFGLFIFLSPVSAQQKIDLLVYNATIYTIDKNFSKKEAFAVHKGKIVATGKIEDLIKKYIAKEKIDGNGKYIYPGFIDAMLIFFIMGSVYKKLTWWESIVGMRQ